MMSPHRSNRSSTPCKYYQAGKCQRPECPFLHDQNPMISMIGFDNSMGAPFPPLHSSKFQTALKKSEIQCRFELDKSSGCKNKKCQFFHKFKGPNPPKGRNKNKKDQNKTNTPDDEPSTSDTISLPPPSPTVKKSNTKSPGAANSKSNKTTKRPNLDLSESEPENKRHKDDVTSNQLTSSNTAVVLHKHLSRMRYKIITKFSRTDNKFSFHPKKLTCIDKDELVTIIGHCHNCPSEYINCPYVEVKDVFKNVGFVHQDCIGDDEILFPCPLKNSCGKFPSEEAYLSHLCREHYYDKLIRLLEGPSSNLYKCPDSSCGKSCSNLEGLVLHYGALPHEKVLCLLLEDSVKADTRKSSEPEVIMVPDFDNVDIRKEKNDLEKERDELDSQVVDLKRESKEQESLVEKLKKEIHEHTQRQSKNDKITKALNETITKTKKDFELLLSEKDKKIAELEEKRIQTTNDEAQIEKERDDLDSQVIDLKREKKRQDDVFKQMELELQQLRKSDSERRDEILKEVQTDSSQMLKHLDAIEKKMALKDKKIKDLQSKMNEESLVELNHQDMKTLREELENKEIEFCNLKNDHEAMEKERDDLDSSVVELQKELREKELLLIQIESSKNDNHGFEEKVKEKLAEMEETIATKEQIIKEYKEKLKEKTDGFKQQIVVIKKLNSNKAELEVCKNELNQKLAEKDAFVTEKENLLQSLKKNVEELKNQIKEYESDTKLVTLEKQNKLLHDELSRNHNNLQFYQEEITRKEQQIKTFKEKIIYLVNSSLDDK